MVRHSAEDGASAVLVAILLFAFMGVAALAVDLGSVYETKRTLVADTDAAALAGAQELAEGGSCDDARSAAEELLSANLGRTVTLTADDVQCIDGTVRVDFTEQAVSAFSGAVSPDADLNVFSSSTAQYLRTGWQGGGLRPVAACLYDAEIQNWLAGGEGNRYRFSLSGAVTNCGGAPGNWGWTCFDRGHGPYVDDGPTGCDGNNGQARIDTMLRYGYSGVVDLGLAPDEQLLPDEDCDPTTPLVVERCDGKPGSLGSSQDANLIYLRDSGLTFPILGIADYVGVGQNATTSPVAFIGVRLVDFKTNGAMGSRYLEFELVNIFQDGTSAVLTEGSLEGDLAVFLCGHDGGSTCPE